MVGSVLGNVSGMRCCAGAEREREYGIVVLAQTLFLLCWAT